MQPMSRDGGSGEAPTSYHLQPPHAAAQQPPGQAQPPYREPTVVDSQIPARSQIPAQRGRLIGGRYRLGERLGAGGMGTVWKAHDEVVDRDVAVKEPTVPHQLTERERQTAYQRMHREARAAARIDHPSVVTIHDVVVEDGRPWIVMELVRGKSLVEVMDEGTLSPNEAARTVLPVLRALAAAHEKGVLHRDIKPGNVLLGPYDRVVLTDFGIAQVEGEAPLTETGAFVGSPEFIAPERVMGQKAGPASDLFSVGVMLYAAVEGFSPFRRSTTPATLQAVLGAEPQTPVRAGDRLGALIMRLLSKDPAARPTAEQTVRALQEIAEEGSRAPAVLRGPGPLARAAAVLRRNRKARFGLIGALAAAVAAAVAFTVLPLGPDVPDGWKYYDEDQRVRAAFAVPGDFERSANENAVTYNDPGGVYFVSVERITGVEKTALQAANDNLGWMADRPFDSGMQDVRGTVKEAEVQGRPAAELTWTYRDYHGSDTETVRRRKAMIYINDDDIEWKVTVGMPAKGEHTREGDRIFQEVVESLEIKDL